MLRAALLPLLLIAVAPVSAFAGSEPDIKVKGVGGSSGVRSYGLEDYVAGVTAKEMGTTWPLEALKAQSVAARTYAWRLIQSGAGKSYHVRADTSHQVFSGKSAAGENNKKAAAQTRGEVLFFEGKPIEALFHACCGGRGENSEAVFREALPYLRSRPDPHCSRCPKYYWEKDVPGQALRKALIDAGLGDPGLPLRFDVMANTASGRVSELLVTGPLAFLTIAGHDLRSAIGAAKLPSAAFTVSEKTEGVLHFSGSGSGHGVGMCQWGAHTMAEGNHDYKEILRFYYPGTELRKIY